MLDLATYEVGNVLSRGLRWTDADIADQLDDLHAILGHPMVMTPVSLRSAATLAQTYELSFYDASWAAAAGEMGIPRISADRLLLAAGLAESPTQIASRLKLSLN